MDTLGSTPAHTSPGSGGSAGDRASADAARWLRLDGAVNVRDLGGLPTIDGRRTAFGRVLRADNLQELSASDQELLVGTVGVRTVIDLRTSIEVADEGPAPLTANGAVVHRHLSLYPEAPATAESPWHLPDDGDQPAWIGVDDLAVNYLRYLQLRPDSVVAALRAIADPTPPGAVIVHCAAGKDRTGTIAALALAVAGVSPEAIVADYVASAEVIEAILDRLRRSTTYAGGLGTADHHRPRAETMITFLAVLEREFGGPSGWLESVGFGAAERQLLRARLVA